MIVAVDGAIYVAATLDMVPDILTGDCDSVDLEAIKKHFPHVRLLSTPDQEMADLEKAIDAVITLGATNITVIGATGGRMDHTLANTTLLMNARTPLVFVDDFGSMQYLETSSGELERETETCLTFGTVVGDTISLVTFDLETTISITGVEWSLDHSHLAPGTRGVSNIAETNNVIVTVHTGSVFIFHMNKSEIARHSIIPNI